MKSEKKKMALKTCMECHWAELPKLGEWHADGCSRNPANKPFQVGDEAIYGEDPADWPTVYARDTKGAAERYGQIYDEEECILACDDETTEATVVDAAGVVSKWEVSGELVRRYRAKRIRPEEDEGDEGG